MAKVVTQAKSTVSAARPRIRRALVWMGLCLVAALLLAAYTGWLGYGWAHFKARTFPRDEGPLGFVPDSTSTIFVVDPHLLDLTALGSDPAPASLRQTIDHGREDIKNATGIDVRSDVDKIVLAPGLIVARGRFDASKIGGKLGEHRYTAAEYGNTRYMVRQGEDAVAVLDDILIYGDETVLKAALDARSGGHTLEKDDQVTERLNRAGWKHAVILAVRMVDDKPSLRSMLRGGNAPRAVTAAFTTTKAGLDVNAIVDAASSESAEEVRKLIEDKRQSADTIRDWADDPLLKAIADDATLPGIAKAAALRTEGASVRIDAHLDNRALGAAVMPALQRASELLRAP